MNKLIGLPLLVTVLAAAVAGCASIPATSETDTVDTATRSFRMLRYRDYCSAQREIAEHNSVYQTLKTGKVVAYSAPCDVKKKRKAKPEPATS